MGRLAPETAMQRDGAPTDMTTIDPSRPPAFSGWEAYCAAARALSREAQAAPSPLSQPKTESADARSR